MKDHLIILLLPLILSVSGCTLLAHNESSGGSSAAFLDLQSDPHQMAARDIISAMVQTVEFRQNSGPILLPPDDTPFYKSLSESFNELGYSIKNVSYSEQDRGEYSLTTAVEDASKVYRYSLMINGVTIVREYEERMTGLFPKSKMIVTGSNSVIKLDEAEFELQDPSQVFISGVEYANGTPVSVQLASSSYQSNMIDSIETNSATDIDDGARFRLASNTPEEPEFQDQPLADYKDLLNKEPEDLENMYYTNKSNFADIFDEYEEVDKHIIIFANDSKILGPKGKRMAREISRAIDTTNEIVSLVGCSHGNTAIDDGNNILAIGRVKRIKQEFVDLGVEEDGLFAEGCWAPVHFDEVFPRRGVVVTVMRKKT